MNAVDLSLILGGTFDPVHNGHIRIAQDLLSLLKAQEIRFIPCQNPVNKHKAYANAEHRLNMLKIATKDMAEFIVDDREVVRKTPSYTIETLKDLRNSFPQKHFGLVMGTDVFLDFTSWKEWQKILEYANIILVKRPNYEINLSSQINPLLLTRLTSNTEVLNQDTVGHILQLELSLLDISATEIRALLAQGQSPDNLLPNAVLNYILQNHLYSTHM